MTRSSHSGSIFLASLFLIFCGIDFLHAESAASHPVPHPVMSVTGGEHSGDHLKSVGPGPLLRARVGDTVELTLKNHSTSSHNHSIDLHAVTGPGGGAQMTRVKPGETKTITFKAVHPGVFVYHCATPNVPSHIANGLYGMIVIDPAEGWRAVDREFYVMQGEVYTKGGVGQQGFQAFSPSKMMDERPEYILLTAGLKP